MAGKPVQWHECACAPDGDCIIFNCCCPCIGVYRDANVLGFPGLMWGLGALACYFFGVACIPALFFKMKANEEMLKNGGVVDAGDGDITLMNVCCSWCCHPCFMQQISRTVRDYKAAGFGPMASPQAKAAAAPPAQVPMNTA